MVAVVAAIAVLAGLVGWTAGQRIRSPGEIAAETAPPEPSVITVPVEFRELAQSVVVRGTVRANDATEVSVSSTAGSSIITRLPKEAGDEIKEGDVLIEVSGRPVIALQGELPVFRSLIPSLEGPDVAQLERALNRLGHDPGTIDETYDADTAKAVEALYTEAGYSAPETPEAERQTLQAARDSLNALREAVVQAEGALNEAKTPLQDSERLQLDQQLTAARNSLEEIKAAAVEANTQAAAAITRAQVVRGQTAAELETANKRLVEAQAGTHPDTGIAPTDDELDQLEAGRDDAQVALEAAEAELEAAKAAQTATATRNGNSIAEAEANLKIQEAFRRERLAGVDTSAQRSALTEVRRQLSEAQSQFAEAQTKVGAPFPAAELVFFPTLPRQVQALGVEVGDSPGGPAMTISGAETRIESGVSSANRRLIETGAEALVEDESLGIEARAVVTFVADSPGGGELSSDRYGLILEPVDALPEDAINLNLRISIPISSSGGKVLAVPFAALSAAPDGTPRLEVQRSSDLIEVVEVTTGLRADGLVEVEPVGAELKPGDRVVVGRDLGFDVGQDGDVDPDDESGDRGDEPDPSEESDGDAAPFVGRGRGEP